jgi:hypothetical protein
VVFSFLKRISDTPLATEGSVALSASVTVRLVVMEAPLFIVAVPVGMFASILTVLEAEAAEVLLALTVAFTV